MRSGRDAGLWAAMIPVLTPHPAWDSEAKELAQPVSVADLGQEVGKRRRLCNSRSTTKVLTKGGITTTLYLLEKELGLKRDVDEEEAKERKQEEKEEKKKRLGVRMRRRRRRWIILRSCS